MIAPAHDVRPLPRNQTPPTRQTIPLRAIDFMRPSFLEPQPGITPTDLKDGQDLYQKLLQEFPGLPHYAGCIANLGLGRTPSPTMIRNARHEHKANDKANLEHLKQVLQEPQIATIIKKYVTFPDPLRTSGA